MTSTRRWTGWSTGRTRSRPSWPAATWPRSPTRRGWRCSTCPARGWKARTARWPPAATPGTARKGNCRSSTGCSPTRTGRPVAVRVFPGNTGDPAAFTAIVGRGAEEVRAGPDGHGRRPRDDHQRPDPGPEPAGGRDAAAGPLRVDHRAARPRHPQADGRRRPAPAVACSTSRTSPRSPPTTSPASGWSPAATRCWPPTAPAPARTCWPPPRSCSPPSSPASRPASSPAPGRSGSRSAR